MGDASLRVQTKYPTAGALLHVVGTTMERGSLRVPIHVAFEQPFELILASLDGEEPVCGTAEVVEHAGDATWVRFLSASPESTTDTARCVLVDTEVMSPASLTAKAEAFEAITAVTDAPAQIAEIPSGTAEPVRVALLPLPPPPDPLFDVTDASRVGPLPAAPSSTIAEAAAAACASEAARNEGETTMVESRRDVDIAALAALEGRFDALSDVVPPSERVTARGEVVAIGEPPALVTDASATTGVDESDDLRVPHTGESRPLVVDVASHDENALMMPVVPSLTSKHQVTREAQAAVVAAGVHATELTMPALESPAADEPATNESQAVLGDSAHTTELTMPALESPTAMPRIEPTETALGSGTPQPVPADRPTAESRPIVFDAAAAPAAVTDAGSAAVIVDSNPPDDQRPTVESPPIVASLVQMTSGDDAVAAQRGIRAITNPYAKGGMPSSSRRVVIVAASVAAVSLLVAAGSLMWAHDAVAHAERPEPARVATTAPVTAPVVEQQPAVVEPPGIDQPPVVAQPAVEAPATQPTSCTLDVFASVADSSVYVNGAANGSTPATATVECGKPVNVEIRHARYEVFKRTVTPTNAREELRATLEREKTALHVWSEPAGASVTYNGAPIGKTPLTVKIPRYEQGTLNFSMSGMQADWRRIVPKTAEKTVTIALRKR